MYAVDSSGALSSERVKTLERTSRSHAARTSGLVAAGASPPWNVTDLTRPLRSILTIMTTEPVTVLGTLLYEGIAHPPPTRPVPRPLTDEFLPPGRPESPGFLPLLSVLSLPALRNAEPSSFLA